jgi:uracil-DNA glycosylase family 4
MKLLNRNWAEQPINRKRKTLNKQKPKQFKLKVDQSPELQQPAGKINTIEGLWAQMQKINHEFNNGVANFVPGEIGGDFLIIGEAPGAKEGELKKPCIGKSDQLIRSELKNQGLDPQDMSIINTVYYRPPNNKTPDNATIRAYLPYLKEYIRILKPKFILTTGSVPLKAVMGFDKRITKIRGQLFSYENIPLVPTYHPAFVLRLGNKGIARESFINDLKFAIKAYYEAK